MKCKFCDGSGKDYWCLNGDPYPCPVCNGTGSINNIQCPSCEGFGQISEQTSTNEEWFCRLSTEEKTDMFFSIAFACSRCGDESYSDEEKIKTCPFGKIGCTKKDWEKWLKQPHKIK